MPESILLAYPIETTVRPGSYLVAFCDNADGVVNEALPVSVRVPVWPKGVSETFWLDEPWLGSSFLEEAPPACFIEDSWLESPWLEANLLPIVRAGYFYGPTGLNQMLFRTKLFDQHGQTTGSANPDATVVFNASPSPPRTLRATSITGDVLTITFTPSHSLTGNGVIR